MAERGSLPVGASLLATGAMPHGYTASLAYRH